MNSKMNSKFVTRFALTALMSLSACLSLNAQADVASQSAIAFSVPDEMTVHKTTSCCPVAMTVADPAGVTSATLSGGYANAAGHFPAGTKSALIRLYFFASYFPTGDYPFKGTVTNANGVQTTRTVMVHLVP